MQLGQRRIQALGLGLCAAAVAAAALVPRGDDSATAEPASRGAAVTSSGGEQRPTTGGSLAATVSWPQGTAGRADICVVLFDEHGGVTGDPAGRLEPVPGGSLDARWTADGLAPGRYTLQVGPCVLPGGADRRVPLEPQFLGGGGHASAARWVRVDSGELVDVGTIALAGAPGRRAQRS